MRFLDTKCMIQWNSSDAIIARLGWISARRTLDSALGEDSKFPKEQVFAEYIELFLRSKLYCIELAEKARFHDAVLRPH